MSKKLITDDDLSAIGNITRNYINPTIAETSNDSGTAESGNTTTLTDTDKSWTADEWIGYYVKITAGTGSGQIKKITDNDATSLTAAFDTAPDNTSVYEIVSYSLTLNFATKNEVFATLSGGGAIVVDKNITIAYSNDTNFKSGWLAIDVQTETRTIVFPANHKSGDYRWDTLVLTLGVGKYQISIMNNGNYKSVICSEIEE